MQSEDIKATQIEKTFSIVKNNYVNKNMATIRERGVTAIAIDATENEEGNECTLLVAPEMFCKHILSSGFWDNFFLKLKAVLIIISIISLMNSMKGFMKDDPKLITSNFERLMIVTSAITSVTDFALDATACAIFPWSREGFRYMYIVASFGTLFVAYSYTIANKIFSQSEFGEDS